jgi:hypothetical protein
VWPPFDPATVVRRFVERARPYYVREITGDAWASVREQLLTELLAETWKALDATEQATIHRSTYDRGQEEGRTRAAIARAGEDPQALFKQQRMLAFRARVQDARDVGRSAP